MPDADDFDVEYLRSLLKGNAAREEVKTPPAAKKPGRREVSGARKKPAPKPGKRAGR